MNYIAMFTDQRSRSPVLFPASVSYSLLSYGNRVIEGFVGNVTSVTHIPKETWNARYVLTGCIVHLIRLCITPVKYFTKGTVPVKIMDTSDYIYIYIYMFFMIFKTLEIVEVLYAIINSAWVWISLQKYLL